MKKKNLNFTLEVFDGKNTVKTPVSIKIDNVNELSASVDLSDEKVLKEAL